MDIIFATVFLFVHNVENDSISKDLTGLYEEIQKVRRDMEASAATGRTMKSTTAWKNLKKSYHLDVKVNNVPWYSSEYACMIL